MIIDKIAFGGKFAINNVTEIKGTVSQSVPYIKSYTLVSGTQDNIIPFNGNAYGVALETRFKGDKIRILKRIK